MSYEDRLRRHLSQFADGWDLDHLMLCDECEIIDEPYDGAYWRRCDVAEAHYEMGQEFYRRAHPIRSVSGSGIKLDAVSQILEDAYVPALKAYLISESDLLYNLQRRATFHHRRPS